jgi:glycosyltransferase involved in cell wall biosynthesis
MIKNRNLKEEIDNIIENYSLPKKIIFLGYVSNENLNNIYQKAQALVFPSSFEGFGLPIIEAFKNGLPIISANNSSLNEIVGDAGLLFETNNLEMLTECVKKILTDKNLREQLINKGTERARIFNWKNTAEQTLLLFNKVGANT